MSRLAAVGDRIYVADFTFCDSYAKTFPNIVHISSDKDRADGRACRVCATGDGPGFIVRWSEGQSLSAMSVPLDEVAAFARRPGRLLVHCSGAVCRSPTLAIAAKVARGRDVMDAIRRAADPDARPDAGVADVGGLAEVGLVSVALTEPIPVGDQQLQAARLARALRQRRAAEHPGRE
jgi:hypothetical protein